MEDCEECVMLFEDRGSGQLYTIAYTEDDDFANTNQNLINQAIERLKRLTKEARPSAAAIAIAE